MEHAELLARLDERSRHIDEKVDAILEQTLKTNGRMTAAEKDISEIKTWREVLRGQWRVVVIVSTGVGAGVGFLIKHILG